MNEESEVVRPAEAKATAVEPATVEPATVEPATVEPAAVEPATVEATAVEPATRPVADRRPPASILALFVIFVIAGGAIEGYALATAAMPGLAGASWAPGWAFLGAALVVTGWALRGHRWWGAAAAIGVAIVGMVAAMYGVNILLVVLSTPQVAGGDERWTLGVGLVAVGAASIATIGLLSSAWAWLMSPAGRRTR